MSWTTSYTDEDVREAVGISLRYSDVLRAVGLRTAGGNHRSIRRRIERLGLSTEHFDPNANRRELNRGRQTPLDELLVEHSTYSRNHLKRRLYSEGLKQRRCEMCGQDERWRGRRMALILDHISGVADDNRLENLRIVCPNCAAALETHCGRNKKRVHRPRPCAGCGEAFVASHHPPAVLLTRLRRALPGSLRVAPQGRPPTPRPAPRRGRGARILRHRP